MATRQKFETVDDCILSTSPSVGQITPLPFINQLIKYHIKEQVAK